MTDTELLDWIIEQRDICFSEASEWFLDGARVELPVYKIPDWEQLRDSGRLKLVRVGYVVSTNLAIESTGKDYGSASTPREAIKRAIMESLQWKVEQAVVPAGGKK
jgi:hypothetical protein